MRDSPQVPGSRAEIDRSHIGKGRAGPHRMNSPTRRRFLRDGSMATAVAMLPPFFLQTSSKSGSRLPVVDSGVHTYECVHDWLVPPDGLVWGDTHGLVQDEQGNIYVAHTVNKSSMRGEAVVVYDASGRFVRAFGEEFRGGAHGLGVRQEKGAEDFSEKSCGRATVTTNSTRHTASSWTPAVGFQSSWLRIVGTGAFKPFPWTAHIFAPLKTSRDSVCLVTFIRKVTGWSVRTSTARFAFSTASTRSSCNWETAALQTGKLAHAGDSRATNSLPGNSSRPTRQFSFTAATF